MVDAATITNTLLIISVNYLKKKKKTGVGNTNYTALYVCKGI
jgi:hypothetical protein